MKRFRIFAFALLGMAVGCAAQAAGCMLKRNAVIFVADGLRRGSVTAEDAPTLLRLAREGVDFTNSHSLFPTFTTPNASAIATGHYLGDTGDVGNYLFTGYRSFDSGNFNQPVGTPTPFIESDRVLADLNDHFEGNYLNEESLLALAREQGCSTAAIGKLGPAAIQDVRQMKVREAGFEVPQTLILDDVTGDEGVPLPQDLLDALKAAKLPVRTPERLQGAGSSQEAGTRNANWGQQVYLIDATTRAVLPLFKKRGAPFVLVYWSRDPDGTQHNQGDSLDQLSPGINGPTSRAAIRNADHNLELLLQAIDSDPDLAASTDVFVTSDHGFATISKSVVDQAGTMTRSAAAANRYKEVKQGYLPPGFLAIDLAGMLGEKLFDPDQISKGAHGTPLFREIHPDRGERPAAGNGFIGGTGSSRQPFDAKVVVAANGGSDLIYVPDGDAERVRRMVAFLAQQDYTGALFVDDRYGNVPGALPFSAIGLQGSGTLPTAAIVIGFRTFVLPAKQRTVFSDPLQNAVQIADTPLQQGQGMHGSFGRDNTYNFMAARGPDFRRGFSDPLPVGNADIAPTLASVLGLALPARGAKTGRVIGEALSGTAPGKLPTADRCVRASQPTPQGLRTVLDFQRTQDRHYYDTAALRTLQPDEKQGCSK